LNPNQGIFVVEVKGGGVRFDPGDGPKWYSVDRNGLEHEISDPFEQSKKYQYRILDLLKARIRGLRKSKFPIGHSVAFPDIKQTELGQIIAHNRPREIVACAEDLHNLADWYEKSTKFWSGRRETEALGIQSMKEIERVFLKPVYAKPSLSVTLEDEEAQRIKLTDDQSRLLRCLDNHDRVNISGGAGTGKTVLAKEVAEKFALAGKKTALICYNKALGDQLEASLGAEESVVAGTYHSVFQRLLGGAFQRYLMEAREAYPNEDEWRVIRPLAFLMALDSDDSLKFDAVVVDEGQDFGPEMWLSVEQMLKNDESKLFVFSDAHQGLYYSVDHLPKLGPPFLLHTNCRNTKQIHESAYRNYEGHPISPPSIEGEIVHISHNESLVAQSAEVISILDSLIGEGDLKPEDIVILVANSLNLPGVIEQLRSLERKYNFLKREDVNEGCIRVSTVKRFKGLEAKAVVVWGLNELPAQDEKELRYVGITRAKSLCYLVN
jgi:hypothetical protein